jgi:hypothetical protein
MTNDGTSSVNLILFHLSRVKPGVNGYGTGTTLLDKMGGCDVFLKLSVSFVQVPIAAVSMIFDR